METINKRHEAITSNQRVNLAAYFKMESEKTVYFSAGDAAGLHPTLASTTTVAAIPAL